MTVPQLITAAAFAALSAAASAADSTWFTIVGEPAKPLVDTIQVDAVAVEIKDHTRTMRVRINRSRPIVSPDNVRAHSFSSIVRIDCQQMSARYLATDFFPEPLWQGTPVRMEYTDEQVRPMVFRDFEPNPNMRVIRAACAMGN